MSAGARRLPHKRTHPSTYLFTPLEKYTLDLMKYINAFWIIFFPLFMYNRYICLPVCICVYGCMVRYFSLSSSVCLFSSHYYYDFFSPFIPHERYNSVKCKCFGQINKYPFLTSLTEQCVVY